jgi:hypothetical protein
MQGRDPVNETKRGVKGVIRELFADHLPTILAEREGHELSEREWRGAWCIATCRTAQQGTHVRDCPDGHGGAEAFNSCHHRGCPQCGWPATQRWIERREAQVLACAHVHTIWTMPGVFDALWLYNRPTFTALLFRGVWETVRTLMADPQWCGARPGMLAAFQSFGDYNQLHPHVHALVTGGGVDAHGNWREPAHDVVLCARVAMPLFRGKMRAFILAGLADGTLVCPPGTTATYWTREADRQGLRKWNVQVQPPYTETGRVIRYIGAYLKRGPLTDRRVQRYDGRTVTIAHRHPDKHDAPTFALDGPECVRRLLLHMPEPRQHTSRLYGLYHPSARKLLDAARQHLGQAPAPATAPESAAVTHARRFPGTSPPVCPVCGRPLRVRVLIHGGQSPPQSFRLQQQRRAA